MKLDQLLEYTEKLKVEIRELELHEDDVRHSFFGLYYSSIYDYYIGKASYQLAQFIGNGDVRFSEKIYPFRIHAERLFEIQELELLSRGYHGNLNRNIIFGVWTSFELSISLLFEHLVTENDLITIIDKINSKLIKAIEHLEDKEKSIITNNIRKSAFIPLVRKFNFLVKRIPNSYTGNLKEDREFLNFAVKLRNCMIHSNGIYHGKDYYYKFGEEKFKFINKEMFLQKGPNSRDVYLDISIRIKTIFRNLMNCMNDIDYIEYPDDGQNIA
ncbi:hypothetical protein [Wenyingzhuangia sp. 2_MG-2023]|uniref:hypothetical protein n=1 Tax=Wenyingzhuangia sp. 2_MG-2023 TaxID=3062639 RepID=UPI0026E2B881|nr:hypothetical protein [Wenyingzhuangia sp. 2_MG-2023]MDO6739488.1 hypothetical protein [Wenyingzhuangia sp. 2_MG-2023]